MNEKRKITLKDIAKELKLSPSTVSRALNGYPSLSEETIQLVKEYATKHQYVPNTMAVNFRKNRTSILGMIVPQIVHHFFSTTISGALEAAKKRGYSILLAQSYDHLKDEVLASQYLLGMGVDGLLISVSNETKEAEHLQAFLDEAKAVDGPDVSVSSVFSLSDTWGSSSATATTRSNALSLTLNAPIWSNGVNAARIEVAMAAVDSARASLESETRKARRDIEVAIQELRASSRTVDARLLSIRSAASRVEATEAAYSVGSGDIVEVLNAKELRLDQAMGDLSESRLVELESVLIP